MPVAAKPSKKLLLIYDFDWSLIDEDSDSYVFKQLYPDLHQTMQDLHDKMQFTDLVDHMLGLMQEKPDFTIDRLRACLVSIPFHEKMLLLMKECQAKHADIMDVLIISDANTFYIHEILTAHGIRDFFGDRIITNPASFSSSGRLRVSRLIPATDPPHNCINKCAVNICKGRELETFLSQKSSYSYERMVYVGDSKNDVCPSLSLKSTDLVLARKGRSMEAILKQDEFQSRLKAKLVIWNDGLDVYDIVKGVLLS